MISFTVAEMVDILNGWKLKPSTVQVIARSAWWEASFRVEIMEVFPEGRVQLMGPSGLLTLDFSAEGVKRMYTEPSDSTEESEEVRALFGATAESGLYLRFPDGSQCLLTQLRDLTSLESSL
jgi:hypothetical protein